MLNMFPNLALAAQRIVVAIPSGIADECTLGGERVVKSRRSREDGHAARARRRALARAAGLSRAPLRQRSHAIVAPPVAAYAAERLPAGSDAARPLCPGATTR